MQSFVLELLLTAFLMFVILNSTTGAQEKMYQRMSSEFSAVGCEDGKSSRGAV
jgi:glycerol uptake facilitator-like aquaporin